MRSESLIALSRRCTLDPEGASESGHNRTNSSPRSPGRLRWGAMQSWASLVGRRSSPWPLRVRHPEPDPACDTPECPSPSTQAARRGRAILKGVPRATLTVGRLMLFHAFWIGATLVALPVLVVLRMLQLPVRFAGLVLLCVLGVPLAAACLVGRTAWRAYGRLRLSLERAWRREIRGRARTWTLLPSPAARESGKEWLGWMASGVLVWTVAIAEALFLTARDIEEVERRARDARRWSGSEISVDDDEEDEEAEEETK